MKEHIDFEYWKHLYEEYLQGSSILDLSKKHDISRKTISRIFKKLNFKTRNMSDCCKMSSSKTNSTKLKKYGTLSLGGGGDRHASYLNKLKSNLSYWEHLYGKYLSGKSIGDLASEEKCSRKKISDAFRNLSFKLRDTKDNSILFLDRVKKSNIEKYGVPYSTQNKEVLDKIKTTCIKKYGGISPMHSDDVKNKVLISNNKRVFKKWSSYLEANNYQLVSEFKGVNDTDHSWIYYKFLHKNCGTLFEDTFNNGCVRCPHCFPNNVSKGELELKKLLSSLDINFIDNKKRYLDNRFELDIYIPENKIAFEYNGDYWHSSVNKDKNYHKNKTDLALSKDIKLYHIWEHDNVHVLESMIKSKLGIISTRHYARKLITEEVPTKERQLFFDTNHLHGDVKSKFALGLYYKGELISCISFRTHREGVEIARFATKLNSSVVGGFSKLLKYSIAILKDMGYNKIVTYCDRDWTPDYKDSVYFKNGFKFVGDTGVQLKYYDNKKNNVLTRETFQKHKLKELFPDTYEDGLTANEILEKNKIYALHNSGNWKFELEI